jgi:ATP-binding cassette subfamily B protein
VVLVIWLGGLEAIRGELSVGQIVAFTNYMLMTMFPLVMMTMLSNVWAAGLASSRRMNDIMDSTPDIEDAPNARLLSPDSVPRIAFEDVSFSYGGEASEPVLRGLSFVVEPGQTVAILGATGAGKSTLVNLIPRFYEVTGGRVRVGDHDVRELTQDSLVAAIGVVPQQAVLFSGTVRDNVRYGRPDAPDEDVIAAARAAQADGFIARLPAGYESRVEQRGVNLSGGQKQRLALARALLLKPRILVLDDSTSAVDTETESRIQEELAKEKGKRTVIIVAQRISSARSADKILVLDRGRLVAEGSHRELIETSRVYREIHDSQLGTRSSS